jgi:hypothetical protein
VITFHVEIESSGDEDLSWVEEQDWNDWTAEAGALILRKGSTTFIFPWHALKYAEIKS